MSAFPLLRGMSANNEILPPDRSKVIGAVDRAVEDDPPATNIDRTIIRRDIEP